MTDSSTESSLDPTGIPVEGIVMPAVAANRGLTKEQLEAAERVLDHARAASPAPAADQPQA
jgi:hypothetical protein